MALVMGVVSPYWMKTINPAVAAINGPQKNTATTSATAITAGGQK
jgi:hypothetical protein